MHTQEELKNAVYFWKEGNKSLGWLSQWYYCPFKDDKDDKIVYQSAEQYDASTTYREEPGNG